MIEECSPKYHKFTSIVFLIYFTYHLLSLSHCLFICRKKGKRRVKDNKKESTGSVQLVPDFYINKKNIKRD